MWPPWASCLTILTLLSSPLRIKHETMRFIQLEQSAITQECAITRRVRHSGGRLPYTAVVSMSWCSDEYSEDRTVSDIVQWICESEFEMELIREEMQFTKQFTSKSKLEEYYEKVTRIIIDRDLENQAYEKIGYLFLCVNVPVNAVPPSYLAVESTNIEREKRIKGEIDVSMVTAGDGLYTPLARQGAPRGTWFSATLFDGKLPEKFRYSNARLKIPIPRLIWYLSNIQQFQPLHTLGVPTTQNGNGINQYAVDVELPALFLEHVHHDTLTHVRLVLVRKGSADYYWCEEHLKRLDLFDNPFLKYESSTWKTIKTTRAMDPRFYVEIFVVGDLDLQTVVYTWETVTPYNSPIAGIYEQRQPAERDQVC